jgi:hypothetical protein
LVVVGNLIKCSDFCPGVGEVRGSSARPGVTRVGDFSVGPHASRSVVEVLSRTGCGRGVPVEGVSYESEPERGRGAPSSRPRTRRTDVRFLGGLRFTVA